MLDKNGNGARRMVRVEDVAREAGVSPITVSRALSNPEKVKEETRKKVEAAVAKTGYVVNRFASSLRSGHSTIISMFVSNLANPHYGRAIQGCADALEGSRYHLLMAQTGYSAKMQESMLAEVMPFRPAAMIFTGRIHSQPMRDQLRAMDLPVMEMWDHAPDPVDMLVGFSAAEGGKLMGSHFVARRFKSVAYAGWSDDDDGQRLAGFVDGLGRRPELVLPIAGPRNFEAGMLAFSTILKKLPTCDAVFFGGDDLAVGALLQARKMGVDVPGKVAVAGYGDLEFSQHVTPAITTLHVSGYEMGRAAGDMLLKRLLKQESGPRSVLSPIELMVRESTG